MSLNSRQRASTAAELAANLELSGLTEEEAAARAHLDPRRFAAALRLEPDADPRDVWAVRDALEQAVLDAGRSPVPYSSLTESMRGAAGAWFGVPPRD